MSVLIKGMKMPENCVACTFSGWSNLHQTAACKICEYDPCFDDHSREYMSKKANFCPLVEIPAKHGRLIDEDNVIDAIHERLHVLQTHSEFNKKHADIDLLGVIPYISKIQPVIEAEDE